MAAVAAEPRATGAPSTVRDGSELETEQAATSIRVETECANECPPVMDTAPLSNDGDAARECQAHIEEQDRPESEAAGKTHSTSAEHTRATHPVESEAEVAPKCQALADLVREGGNLVTEFLPNVMAPNEVSVNESHSCSNPTFSYSSNPSAISQHSHPDRPRVMETGAASDAQTFGEPLETVAANPVLPAPDITQTASTEHEKTLTRPLLQTGPESELVRDAAVSECESELSESSGPKSPRTADRSDSSAVLEKMDILGTTEENKTVLDRINPAPCHPSDLSATADGLFHVLSGPGDALAPQRRLGGDSEQPGPGLKRTVPCAQAVTHLIPGSEVRVSLDHIIDDALVVSFQLGERIFSGVLMDLSKRFGPYGIPVTVFPKREYRDKPESMQLKKEPFQSETEKGEGQASSGGPQEPERPSALSDSSPALCTSKPPPLFQEGVPYPPPLFIRDTYNQSLPQPLPRKIKRPKRRLYREEPTSILNAIRLRPRQVLCDKCKGVVVGGAERREPRRGPGSDCRGDEAKRRRAEAPAVAKRPRCEERGRSQGKGGGNRVVKGVPGSASSAAAGAKKVLQSKNVDHSKAREVLKMAQRRQRDTGVGTNSKTTRASSLRDAHQKVHFTRRLHQISAGGGGGPRIRIKPQSTATLKGC